MRRKYHNRVEVVHRLNQPGAPSIAVLSEETGIPGTPGSRHAPGVRSGVVVTPLHCNPSGEW